MLLGPHPTHAGEKRDTSLGGGQAPGRAPREATGTSSSNPTLPFGHEPRVHPPLPTPTPHPHLPREAQEPPALQWTDLISNSLI